MKKIKYILLCILFIIFIMPNVHAASINTYVNGTSSIYPGNTIKISVGVSKAPLLYGFTGKINYDTSKLTLKSSSGLSGFSVLLGENLTADSASGKSGTFSFLELVFTPTKNFKAGEKTTISFSNGETSDGNNTLKCSTSSLSITMKAPKSKNNFLSNLTIDAGEIAFNKNKDTYSIVVDNDVSNIKINAQAEDKKSKVSGVGSKSLEIYENVFKVIVTSESGSKKTYTIIVTRKDKDGKTTKPKVEKVKPVLDDLKIEGYDLEFNKAVYEYSIKLKDNDTKLNIIPSYDKTKYTCDINIPKELIVGENLIKITLKDKENNTVVYSIIAFKNEIIKDEGIKDEIKECPTCNCTPTSCKYKNIFIIENILLVVILILLYLLKVKKKKKKDDTEIINLYD